MRVVTIIFAVLGVIFVLGLIAAAFTNAKTVSQYKQWKAENQNA